MFVALSLASAAAFAAPVAAQTVDPVFTGPRIEGTIGWDNLKAGSSVDAPGGGDRQSTDGLMYGVGLGYDLAIGGVVVGAEAELADSTARTGRRSYTQDFGYGRVNAGRDIYVGARAGIEVAPSTLVYVKGGYTNARLNVLAGNSNLSTDTDFNLDGWRVGAGAEHALSPNSFVKLEYRYSNYNRGDIRYPDGASTARFDVDTDRHQIAASYGFRF
jgi:outer membrane immunogenic protein